MPDRPMTAEESAEFFARRETRDAETVERVNGRSQSGSGGQTASAENSTAEGSAANSRDGHTPRFPHGTKFSSLTPEQQDNEFTELMKKHGDTPVTLRDFSRITENIATMTRQAIDMKLAQFRLLRPSYLVAPGAPLPSPMSEDFIELAIDIALGGCALPAGSPSGFRIRFVAPDDFHRGVLRLAADNSAHFVLAFTERCWGQCMYRCGFQLGYSLSYMGQVSSDDGDLGESSLDAVQVVVEGLARHVVRAAAVRMAESEFFHFRQNASVLADYPDVFSENPRADKIAEYFAMRPEIKADICTLPALPGATYAELTTAWRERCARLRTPAVLPGLVAETLE
jgi:hypothetical protein